MHPAGSVIFFTVASGAGYGVLAFAGTLAALGMAPDDWLVGFAAMSLGLGLVTAGLLSSSFHLGHPERAWRAFSQWRSSWLSREGIAAIVTYGPALALAWVWVVEGDPNGATGRAAGLALIVMSGVTVAATGMIYRSLKPIPEWHNAWTVPAYLVLGLASGGMAFSAALALTGAPMPALVLASILLTIAGLFIKRGYWHALSAGFARPSRESATGLAAIGRVRPFEDPHSSDNYLLKEMGFRVGRKHAEKLRKIALMAGFYAPPALAAPSFAAPDAVLTSAALAAAALSMAAGMLAERWLFFAEARHVVALYYRETDAAV